MHTIKTRDEARLDGDKHYFTGVPCGNGHTSKRYTSKGSCITCENIKSMEYVRTHKKSILLTKAKNRAKRKNLEFNIDISDVIIPKVCPVLGINIIEDLQGRNTHNSPSIDRIDNTGGYTKGNVRVISHRANQLKVDATAAEMRLITKDLEKIEKQLYGSR